MDVEVEDIAHGLAFVARWNGQTRGDWPYSVAEHSLLVEDAYRRQGGSDPRWQLAALLHDAPEYVIGDMISPFKAVIGESYKTVEARLQSAIHLRFSLPSITPASLARIVKQADKGAAYIEAVRVAGFDVDEADQFFGRPKIGMRNIEALVAPMDSAHAEDLFLQRFRELQDEMEAPVL